MFTIGKLRETENSEVQLLGREGGKKEGRRVSGPAE